MKIIILNNKYSIYQFSSDADLPDWIYSSEFYSITRTRDETSVVALHNANIPDDVRCDSRWRILKIEGPLDLSSTGFIAGISEIFKNNNIPIFTISTYDTDYILIKENSLETGNKALMECGHNVLYED